MCFFGGARYTRPLEEPLRKKFRLLAGLRRTCVVGMSRGARFQRFTEGAEFVLLPELPVPALRYVLVSTLGLAALLWCVFRRGARVIVAQSPYEGAPAAAARLVARLFGRRVALVVESFGDFEEGIFLQRRVAMERLTRGLMRAAAGFAIRSADLLRAVSGSAEEQLRRWAPGRPIHKFPAWTDMEAFLRLGASGLPREAQTVLFVGMQMPLKGIHHLLRAFVAVAGEFSGARLVVIGPEQNRGYADSLREEASRAPCTDRIRFLGRVCQADLEAWVGRAGLLVLPSLSEGLPRVLVEAMAAGTPVVASRVSGIPEIVEDGRTGWLVPPGDEEALAGALRQALGDRAEATRRAARAREFVVSFFSPEGYREGYRALFDAAEAALQVRAAP